jgi:RNA polymerase primary sigma factor
MSRMFHHDPTAAHDDPEARADDFLADADDPELNGADDDDADDTEADEKDPADAEAEAPAEEEYAGGPDDALGLYLRQMGAIPLLNKEKGNRPRAAARTPPRPVPRCGAVVRPGGRAGGR